MPATITLHPGVGRETVIRKDITVGGSGAWLTIAVTAAASGGSTLEAFDSLQGVNGLAISYTQRHVLTIVAATQGEIADSSTFANTVHMADATMGETAQPNVFTQAHNLIAVNATESELSDPVVFVKNFPIANAIEGETSDPVVMVKNLLEANASQGNLTDVAQTGMTQTDNLTVVSDTMGETADLIALTKGLIDVNATMGIAADAVAMTQLITFGLANATMGETADPDILTKNLIVVPATEGETAAATAITQVDNLIVVPATQGETADPDILTKNLIAVDATEGETATPNVFTQVHVMGVANASEGETADPDVLVKNLIVVPATQGENGLSVSMTSGTASFEVFSATISLELMSAPLARFIGVADAQMGETAQPTTALPILAAVNASKGSVIVGWPYTEGHVVGVANASMGETNAAVGLFTPTNLPDKKLWLSPESGVVVSASNRITTWTDKSGLGNNAVTTSLSAMPWHISAVQNGFNVCEWRANTPVRLIASHVAATSALAQSAASRWSYATVFRLSAVAGTQQRIVQWGVASATTTQVLRIDASSNYVVTNAINNATNSTVRTFGSTVTTPAVLRIQCSAGRINAFQNGVRIATSALADAGLGNRAIGSTPQLMLGCDGANANPMNGWIAEVIVAGTAWASADGRELDKLLGAKYNITIT